LVKVFLVIAAVVDVAIAALLIGVSGFLFGGGPESMRGGPLGLATFAVAVTGCLALPAIGFALNRRGKSLPGLMAAWMPVAGALLATTFPAPY
jgi:hypothetical protein